MTTPAPVGAQHSRNLIRQLYDMRPALCDVEIHCVNDIVGESVVVLFAHRAILAAKCRYFWNVFGNRDADSAQQVAFEASPPRVPPEAVVGTDIEQGPQLPPVIFRESEQLMRPILEFMYFGQLQMLEEQEGTFAEEQYDIICRLLTWSLDHCVTAMSMHLLAHMQRCPLTDMQAARLLELDTEIAYATREHLPSSCDVVVEALAVLRRRALSAFERTPFRETMFLPLTRNGIMLVLQLCTFDVPEIEVVRAVAHWAQHSAWVASTYGGEPMKEKHVNALMLFVDPACLSPSEFAEVDHLFHVNIQDLYWQRFLLDASVMQRQRIEDSAQCRDRSSLFPADDAAPVAQMNGLDVAHGAQYTPPPVEGQHAGARDGYANGGAAQAPPGASFNEAAADGTGTASMARTGHDITRRLLQPQSSHDRAIMAAADTGVNVPEATMPSSLQPAEVRGYVHKLAHAHQGKATSVFIKGSQYIVTAGADASGAWPGSASASIFSLLLSMDSVVYQAAIYRGSIMSGRMKWRWSIVRNCEMFWFGVTANIAHDPSTFIAIDPTTWMISDECFCLEHCRPEAVTAGARKTRRIIVLEQQYFCVDGLPQEHWQDVVLELDSKAGTLSYQINGCPMQCVFRNLPTQRRLYPCVMAINKGQLVFELLEAAML